jgi:hypothetical protein
MRFREIGKNRFLKINFWSFLAQVRFRTIRLSGETEWQNGRSLTSVISAVTWLAAPSTARFTRRRIYCPNGDKWVLPQHKDQFVQGLQEGAAPLHEGITMEWQGLQYTDPTKRKKSAKGGILFSTISIFWWIVRCAIYGGYLGATVQMDQFNEGQIVILGSLIIMPTFLAGNIYYVL